MKCDQDKCEAEATFLYTWPGKDQAGVCFEHAVSLKAIANAIGLYLQLIPIGLLGPE